MTTPEEVKDKVAVKHGYENWRDMITVYNTSSKLDIDSVENEAMRDYAEALYTERIEKASNKLPDKHSINLNSSEYASSKTYFHPFSDGDLDLAFDNGANWMKQAASVVILKEMERTNDILTVLGDRENDIRTLQKNIKNLVEELEQKDKEVAKWKEMYNNVNNKDSQTISGLVGELQKKDKEIVNRKQQWDDLFEDLKQSCYTVYDLIKQLRDKDKEIVELKSEPIKFLKWIAEQDLDNQLTLLDNEWFYESDTDGDQPLEEETLYKNYKTHQH